MKKTTNTEFYSNPRIVSVGKGKLTKIPGGIEIRYFAKNGECLGVARNVSGLLSYYLN